MAVKSIIAVLGIALASTAAASAQTQAPPAGTYDVSDEGLVKSLPRGVRLLGLASLPAAKMRSARMRPRSARRVEHGSAIRRWGSFPV
jgi:hypothetical protein